MAGGGGLGVVRERVVALRAELAEMGDRLYQAPGAELGVVLEELDALEMACGAAKVAVVAEALDRGETSDGAAALTPVGWVRAHAPSTLAGGARQLVELATEFAKTASVPPATAQVRAAVQAGRVPLRSAAVVLAEIDRMRHHLADGAEEAVVEGLLALAEQEGPRGCRLLRPALLARYGLTGALQGEQDTAKRFVALSQPFDTGTGIFEYRLALDPEGKAVVEAALGPLSAPAPADGHPDLRGADRRRGDALLTLVRRAVATPQGLPTTAKAQLFVTVDFAALKDRMSAGTTKGGPDAGTLLAPETVRRIACDADLLPVVLGTEGQVLDFGHTRRLFSPGQVKRLWLRDGGCTYPGCSMPPQWTDAHHLVHWADGGPTNLTNAALLCGHHHTTVHTRRLAGHLHTDHIAWDTTRGSYDTHLAARHAPPTQRDRP